MSCQVWHVPDFIVFQSQAMASVARISDPVDAREFDRLRQKHELYPLAVHCSYLINLASSDPVIRTGSIAGFRGEIERALAIGAEYLILHPGSVKTGDRKTGVDAVVAGLEEAAANLKLNGLTVLIENTVGGGGCLGCDFTEVAELVRRPDLPMGCCLDTAHSYGVGYDLATPAGLGAWISDVEATVGWDAVRVIHTNDSRAPLGSRRDRHEHIGKGGIGHEGFRALVNHEKLRDKPFILKTPIDKKRRRSPSNVEAIRKLHAGTLLTRKRSS